MKNTLCEIIAYEKILKSENNENIVKCFDCIYSKNNIFLIMEYYDEGFKN